MVRPIVTACVLVLLGVIGPSGPDASRAIGADLMAQPLATSSDDVLGDIPPVGGPYLPGGAPHELATCTVCQPSCVSSAGGTALGTPCAHHACDLRLWGVLAPSNLQFDQFVSPMTNPFYFEDPRTLTEVRTIFFRHKVPLPVGGGDVEAAAIQVRAALTDRLSVIITKDGFLASSNPAADDGWIDVNAGLKYNLYVNPCHRTLLSGGVTYELPVGSTRALQGNGDGMFNLFLSGTTQCLGWNVVATRGFLLPTNHHDESTIYYASTHVDHRIASSKFFFVAEGTWFSYLASGDGPIEGFEGGDLFNFGARGVTGNNIVTGALGLKYKPGPTSEFGIAWEKPLSGRRDVMDNRLLLDWIFRY